MSVITAPGVYDGIPEDEYHADPVPAGSLSASGAKLLLPPSCPALYAYRREHPKVSAEFDFGTAAHRYVLGTGPQIEVVMADDWRTKGAREARDSCRAEGIVPLLRDDWAQVRDMAKAIREHPVAGKLFDPAVGMAEQSLFWQDADYGIWRRARLDWQMPGPRLLVVDYKSTPDASPDAIRKHVANFGYFLQAAQYTDGARALGLDPEPGFLFVFQERTPPYLITIAELDDEAIETGRSRMRLACEIFRDCTEAGVWPSYSSEIELISLPPWVARRHEGEW